VNGNQLAAIGGALAGAGVFCALREVVLRPAPPDLSAVLARWNTPTQVTDPAPAGPGGRRYARLAAAASGPLPGLSARELALTGTSAEQLLLRRIVAAALGLAVPVVVWLLGGWFGWAPGIPITGLAALGTAVALSFVPVFAERQKSARVSESFHTAVGALLDLIAQERASGRGPIQALSDAAEVSTSMPFLRIRQALLQAQRAGTSPWQALAELAEQVGVAELSDLADIAASAADGAAVYTTLTKKAATVRATALATERAHANADSERLVLPVALLGLGFLLLMFYPAFIRLLSA
jgi:Flp pilus assembly protein TadB